MTTTIAASGSEPLLEKLRAQARQNPLPPSTNCRSGCGREPAPTWGCVDLRITLVEVYQQLGCWDLAHEAAESVESLLRLAAQPDQARSILALQVATDLMICGSTNEAVRTATAYLQVVAGESEQVDADAFAIAVGPLAVAFYHWGDCSKGLKDLRTVAGRVAGRLVAQSLEVAAVAGEAICQQRDLVVTATGCRRCRVRSWLPAWPRSTPRGWRTGSGCTRPATCAGVTTPH